MALRHINLTRGAASTISSSVRYFLAKKKALMLKKAKNPQMHSGFLKMMKKYSEAGLKKRLEAKSLSKSLKSISKEQSRSLSSRDDEDGFSVLNARSGRDSYSNEGG